MITFIICYSIVLHLSSSLPLISIPIRKHTANRRVLHLAGPDSDSGATELTNCNLKMWYGEICIGSPSKSCFNVGFDTGSSDTWVPAVSLPKTSPYDLSRFDPGSSSSYKQTGEDFKITYADGSEASGISGEDTLTWTSFGLTIPGQKFGLVDSLEQSMQCGETDGMLGLAFSSLAYNHHPTPFENLSPSLQYPMFSFYLDDEPDSNNSELFLGGVNQKYYEVSRFLFVTCSPLEGSRSLTCN